MKIKIHETERRTFQSSEWTSTTEDLIAAGWKISDEEIKALNEGRSVTVWSSNGMRKLFLTKI